MEVNWKNGPSIRAVRRTGKLIKKFFMQHNAAKSRAVASLREGLKRPPPSTFLTDI